MKLRNLLGGHQRHVEAAAPLGFTIVDLLSDDAADEIVETPIVKPSSGLTGFACIIEYVDSKKRSSQRRVTVIRVENAASTRYLFAFCHERRAQRRFRLDRIISAFDITTGEALDCGAVFDVEADHVQASGVTWGLSPQDRADLIAGLNALTFMARCDRDWHPLEREAIEAFVCGWWIRREFEHDPPLDDIAAYADRLRPDAEAFGCSLVRAAENPKLSAYLRRHITCVIEADGYITAEEAHWSRQVAAYLT